MRRTTGVSLTVSGALVAALALTAASTPAGAQPSGRYDFCPKAIPIVNADTQWRHHRLGPGVSLAETFARGGRGWVNIDVVRIDLANPAVSVAPLNHALTSRYLLTTLAAHHQLVAATNAMFFNFGYGAPTVPFISHGRPMVMTSAPEHVAGVGTDGLAEDGHVWLDGDVHANGSSYPLSAINEVAVPQGLTLYTQAWGHHRIPMPAYAEARAVVNNQLVTRGRQQRWLPPGGMLLVARGADAVGWLLGLPMDTPITASRSLGTDAPLPFEQAYGVGTVTVQNPGEVQDGLYCRASERYAARTAIAWKSGGRQLMLVTVESPQASDHYGLDENQMSGLLVALGAARGFALDGGGSTQLVARLKVRITKHIRRHRHHHVVHRVIHRTVKRLVLRVHSRNSVGRAIPVGIGIYNNTA